MKSESDVRKRLAQVVWKYHKLRLSKAMACRIENCKFAVFRTLQSGQTQIYCSYQSSPGSGPQALCLYHSQPSDCPVFALKQSKEEVIKAVEADLKRPLFKRHNMKDVVQLEWVLGEGEEIAGEYESQLLEEFLVYLERRHSLQQKWWYKLWMIITSRLSKQKEVKCSEPAAVEAENPVPPPEPETK